MTRVIPRIRSAIGLALIFCALAINPLSAAPLASEIEGFGSIGHRKDTGLRGHGFVRNDDGIFTTIDAPRASAYTLTFGISEDGSSVGSYVDRRGTLHGFLRDHRKFTTIDFPGAKATFVARMNARGQIIGAYSRRSDTPALVLSHGFMLHRGVFTRVDVPGAKRTQPFGINNRGQIVGEYVDAAGRSHGFLLDNGKFTTIDAPGGNGTIVFDIDDSGRMVGVAFTDGVVTGLGPAFVREASGVFTPITIPDATRIVAYGINNRGQVVGDFEDAARSQTRGFVLENGALTTIDAPDGAGITTVYDINDEGHLAGAYDFVAHGYLQDERGSFFTIDHPDAVRVTGEPISVNNRGQIVGAYADAAGTFRGFLRDKHRFRTIDVPGAEAAQPYRINDHGQIVGAFADEGVVHGFLLDDGDFTTIDPPGSVQTVAFDIDNGGQIAGTYFDAVGTAHGFLRDARGTFTTIDAPGAAATAIFAFNDRGQLVGQSVDADGTSRAFLLEHGVMTTIDVPGGAVQIVPSAINNRGQIVGFYLGDGGRRRGFVWSNGRFRTLAAPPGTLLDPVALDINDRGRIVGVYF